MKIRFLNAIWQPDASNVLMVLPSLAGLSAASCPSHQKEEITIVLGVAWEVPLTYTASLGFTFIKQKGGYKNTASAWYRHIFLLSTRFEICFLFQNETSNLKLG